MRKSIKMKRPHSVGAIYTRPKPSWDSTTQDLSKYRLSKDDLQSKLKSRQPRPLEEYGGPSNLVKMHREDGTPFVLGAKFFDVSAEHKVMPAAKCLTKPSGKENEFDCRSHEEQDEHSARVCIAAQHENQKNTVEDQIFFNESRVRNDSSCAMHQPVDLRAQGSKGQHSNSQPTRHIGLSTTTSVLGNLIPDSADHLSQHSTTNTASLDNYEPGSRSPYVNESGPDQTSRDPLPPNVSIQSHITRSIAVQQQSKDPKSNRADTYIKCGAVRVTAKPQHTGATSSTSNRGQECFISTTSRGNLSPDRPDGTNDVSSFGYKRSVVLAKEQNKEKDMAHLCAACEEISLKMNEFESGSNSDAKWETITKREGASASFTEFLLKVTGRLFDHLGEAEKDRKKLELELQAVKKHAEDSREDIALLRAELDGMKHTLSLEIKQVGQVSENSRTHLLTVDDEQKNLAAQVLSLSRSYEFQCVSNLLSSAFCRNPMSASASKSDLNSQAANTSLFEFPSPSSIGRSTPESSPPWTKAPPATSRDFLADLVGEDSFEDSFDEDRQEEQDVPRPPPKPHSLPRKLPRRLNGVPLSPVQESPLESTPVREAYEARGSAFRDSGPSPTLQQHNVAWSGMSSGLQSCTSAEGGRNRAPTPKERSSPDFTQLRPPAAGSSSRDLAGPTPLATTSRLRGTAGGPAASGLRLPPGRLQEGGDGVPARGRTGGPGV
jgi:regulator of replication initiation timing